MKWTLVSEDGMVKRETSATALLVYEGFFVTFYYGEAAVIIVQ